MAPYSAGGDEAVVTSRKLMFRAHALKRMFERRVDVDDVRQVLESGEVIEAYPDDRPYPSQLVLGRSAARVLHVVAADNAEDDETIVITVYEPDPALWEPGFRRRRRP